MNFLSAKEKSLQIYESPSMRVLNVELHNSICDQSPSLMTVSNDEYEEESTTGWFSNGN